MLNIYAMQLRRLAQGTLLFSSQINNLLGKKKKMEIQNIISSVKGTSQPTEHLCHRGFVPLQRMYKYLGPKTMALLSFRLCWLGQAGKTWSSLGKLPWLLGHLGERTAAPGIASPRGWDLGVLGKLSCPSR